MMIPLTENRFVRKFIISHCSKVGSLCLPTEAVTFHCYTITLIKGKCNVVVQSCLTISVNVDKIGDGFVQGSILICDKIQVGVC